MTAVANARRVAALNPTDKARLAALMRVASWRTDAADTQLPPWNPWTGTTCQYTGDDGTERAYRRWYLRGGRGAGKTWAGARALAELVVALGPRDASGSLREYAIVAPTYEAATSVCVERQSGILVALGGIDGPLVASWNYSRHQITLRSGVIIYVATADNGAVNIQGKNLTGVWCDEVGLWPGRMAEKAWRESIRPAIRKDGSRAIFTGTPKMGNPLVLTLTRDKRVLSVVRTTMDNVANLSAEDVEEMQQEMAGTLLERQELYGEVVEDIPGAMWRMEWILDGWVPPSVLDGPDKLEFDEIVVGWDPAVTAHGTSDEHGIVVCGSVDTGGAQRHVYVLEDCSGVYPPDQAVRVVANAARRWQADRAVVEVNNGGDWIPALVAQVEPTLVVSKVRATRGKVRRAQDIVAATMQGRVHFVADQTDLGKAGVFHKVLDQMTTWTPDSSGSPDRMDGLVWACKWLLDPDSRELRQNGSWAVDWDNF